MILNERLSFLNSFWISAEVVYLQCCLVVNVTWLMYKNTNSDQQAVNDNWHLTVPMSMKIRFKIKSRLRKWNGNEANFIMARDKIVIILVPWQINTCHCFIYFIKFMLFCQCQAHVDLVCYYLQNTNYSSRCQQKLSPSLECSTSPPPPPPPTPVVCPDLSRYFYWSLVRGQWALPFWRGVFCLQVITVHSQSALAEAMSMSIRTLQERRRTI